MPRENRKIFFKKAEVQSAIVNYCMRSNISLLNTRFSDMEMEGGNDEVASLTLVYDPAEGSSLTQKVTFVSAKIAVALIMHCRSHNIPIPKKSNKSLTANKSDSGKEIVLHIRLDTKM